MGAPRKKISSVSLRNFPMAIANCPYLAAWRTRLCSATIANNCGRSREALSRGRRATTTSARVREMALTATIYNLRIDLADIDRGIYETLEICVPRHPSETIEYMFMRVVAYCLEYRDGIELTQGVAAGNEPAVLIRDLTGRITAWIEV